MNFGKSLAKFSGSMVGRNCTVRVAPGQTIHGVCVDATDDELVLASGQRIDTASIVRVTADQWSAGKPPRTLWRIPG